MIRDSTPRPPANANANGRKPAARRACEIETRSESEVKRRRDEHHREHGERAADDERRPASPRREGGEREQQQRGDRDRAAAREHLRARGCSSSRERTSSWPAYCVEARSTHCLRRARRDRVVHDGNEPEHEERGRNGERAEGRESGAQVAPRPERARTRQEPDEREPEEDRVGRDGRRRATKPAAATDAYSAADGTPQRLERERDRGRHEQLPRRRRREARAPCTPRRCPARSRSSAPPAPRHRPGGPDPRKTAHPASYATRIASGASTRREVDDDLLGVDAGRPGDEAEEAVPEREGVARDGGSPSANSPTRSSDRSSNSTSLRARARWKRPSPCDVPATRQSRARGRRPRRRPTTRPGRRAETGVSRARSTRERRDAGDRRAARA